jgi:hypothetical protein
MVQIGLREMRLRLTNAAVCPCNDDNFACTVVVGGNMHCAWSASHRMLRRMLLQASKCALGHFSATRDGMHAANDSGVDIELCCSSYSCCYS